MSGKDWAAEWGYRAAWRLVRMLPRSTAAAAFRFGADRADKRGGAGIERLGYNLRQVVGPEMSDADFALLRRDAMRSYARYWLEVFRLPSSNTRERVEGFYIKHGERLLEYTAAGQGVILALAHAGNWDAAGAWVVGSGMKLTTVAERLKPEAVYERFVAFRESLGMEILPLTGGDRSLLDTLTARIRSGSVVPLLADRDFSERGVEVDFFGRKTKMPAGPAILAIRTGAPLHVVSMWYEPERPTAELRPAIPIPDKSEGPLSTRVRMVTQRIADEFASFIAEHPADWHMLARMFYDKQPPPDDQPPAVAEAPTSAASVPKPAVAPAEPTAKEPTAKEPAVKEPAVAEPTPPVGAGEPGAG